MTTATHPTTNPGDLPFVALARRLIELMQVEEIDVGTALDALSHTYVAIVREQPTVALAASRSLMTAAHACTVPDDGDVCVESLTVGRMRGIH